MGISDSAGNAGPPAPHARRTRKTACSSKRNVVKRIRKERVAASKRKQPAKSKKQDRTTAREGKRRSGTKQAKLIKMLRLKRGATVDEVAKALEWQPHTVRGAIAGALKKRLGLTITSERDERRGRVYRILAEEMTR